MRPERRDLNLTGNNQWFAAMDVKAAAVLRGLGTQFALGGTEALETASLWDVPEIKTAGGLGALKTLGAAAEVVKDAKGRLFAA